MTDKQRGRRFVLPAFSSSHVFLKARCDPGTIFDKTLGRRFPCGVRWLWRVHRSLADEGTGLPITRRLQFSLDDVGCFRCPSHCGVDDSVNLGTTFVEEIQSPPGFLCLPSSQLSEHPPFIRVGRFILPMADKNLCIRIACVSHTHTQPPPPKYTRWGKVDMRKGREVKFC